MYGHIPYLKTVGSKTFRVHPVNSTVVSLLTIQVSALMSGKTKKGTDSQYHEVRKPAPNLMDLFQHTEEKDDQQFTFISQNVIV